MKRKAVITVLILVILAAGGIAAWPKLSQKLKPDVQPSETAEKETAAESESQTEAPEPQETVPAADDAPAGDANADDVPEDDADAPLSDPDVPEGDAYADDAPEGDAEIPEEDPDVPAGDSLINTAPDFTVLDMDGQEVRLSDLFGQPILINFWATWCPPCKAELPYFEEAYQKYGQDIVFLMVDLTDGSRETIDGVKAFAGEYGYSFPVYYDTEYDAVYAYGIDAIPQTFAIDRNGNVIQQQTGSMSESMLKTFTDALLGK